ncbi:MAG TPA: prolipoprotein diacylglyceryl transferase [Polyangiaceae bacterium]|nr:prolipoprotein diacylglyceryl transferase [Polyangiaceae bacterium]
MRNSPNLPGSAERTTLRAMLLLPSYTWDLDPVFLRIPRGGVAATIAGLGALMVVYGLLKKEREQLITGLIFALAGALIWQYMGPTVELRYYSLLFVVVFLGGHALLNWQIKRGGGSPEDAGDFIVYGVLGVLIGARLGHVIFYDYEKALADPVWIFKIWTGGLASHGAVVGLIVAMYLFTKKRGVPFLEGADRFAFSAALGATVVRIGNLFNSEIVGKIVPDQSWGIRFPRNPGDHGAVPIPLRYPSQLYEIALGTLVFIGLLIADRAMGKEKRPRGALIAWFFALYFTGRLFTERYKEIEALDPHSAISMGQYLSVLPALLGWYGIYWAFKHKLPAGWVEPLPAEPARRHGQRPDDEEDEEAEATADEEEEDDDAEDEDAEDDEAEADEADNADAPPTKKAAVDPDVEAEFEAGKLKKPPLKPEPEEP